MAPGKTLWYWDSCIFIAWIKGEERPSGQMEGIDEMVRAIDKGEAILLTSAITRIEVLDSTLTPDQREAFKRVISRTSIQTVACTMRVSDKAHELRDFYQSLGTKLLTPDAIHLATAIIYNADVFYTFDGAGGKERPKKNMKLLPLTGNVASHQLRVEMPNGTPSLFPGIARPPGAEQPKKGHK